MEQVVAGRRLARHSGGHDDDVAPLRSPSWSSPWCPVTLASVQMWDRSAATPGGDIEREVGHVGRLLQQHGHGLPDAARGANTQTFSDAGREKARSRLAGRRSGRECSSSRDSVHDDARGLAACRPAARLSTGRGATPARERRLQTTRRKSRKNSRKLLEGSTTVAHMRMSQEPTFIESLHYSQSSPSASARRGCLSAHPYSKLNKIKILKVSYNIRSFKIELSF